VGAAADTVNTDDPAAGEMIREGAQIRAGDGAGSFIFRAYEHDAHEISARCVHDLRAWLLRWAR
jgi:hypothetical protein